ncbi:MAG: hypothetical protein OCU20_01045 [Methanophagales archaeon]|nr:hypothetical protein [Methanophagales archaeon]MCW7069273.1 hypothetical protein [Methanophagales archaeon]MCW7072479.1 hypothetical protein [Methanophagales archaeon]
MNIEMILLEAFAGILVLSALGVLLSRDNFYSTLFMTLTLVMVATVYTLFDLQPLFVLIVFVFVGVIGIVTVALAATYRAMPERQFSWIWCIPVLMTGVILGFSIFAHPLHGMGMGSQIRFTLQGFLKPESEYQLLFLFLTSLVILLFLSVIKLYRGEES